MGGKEGSGQEYGCSRRKMKQTTGKLLWTGSLSLHSCQMQCPVRRMQEGMWKDTSVYHHHVERSEKPGKEPGRHREPQAPGVFNKKVQREGEAFCRPCSEYVLYTLCRCQAEEFSLATLGGGRAWNITLGPRMGPRPLHQEQPGIC